MIRFLTGACLLAGSMAQALEFPPQTQLQIRQQEVARYDLPIGPWADGALATKPVEGAITREVWRIPSQSLTTAQILQPLRAQLRAAGYDLLFDCQTEACGGFDFRFGMDVLPPPEMQVNLGDFRYLAAQADQSHLSLLVSRSAQAGYVQIIRVTADDASPVAVQPPVTTDAPHQSAPEATTPLAISLNETGRAILSDLDFASGAARLADQPFASLAALADYLADHPRHQIALVGHSDMIGGRAANMALSQQRAAAVRDRLIADHGVDPARVSAEGIAYLAPIASNSSEEGRRANRRVEVVITFGD
jgi:outer membrane protein OmpA-like peptidoglycan-associated protein